MTRLVLVAVTKPFLKRTKQAQKNFIAFGACEYEMIDNVRKPNAGERKDASWKLVE